MSTPLEPWLRKHSFQQSPHQKVVDRVNELSNIVSPGGEVLRTPFGTAVIPPQPSIRPMVAARAKFTTFPDQSTDPGVLLCTLYAGDNTTLTGDEFPVIGMEPHALNDTLLVWQPPGGALGLAYAKRRSPFGTTQPTTQDYIFSVDSSKVVWQEFTTRQMVQVMCAQYPNYSATYPYTCKWWHVRDGDNYNNTTQRSGVCMKSEENNYRNYGVTSSTIWKRNGSDEIPVLPALWTGEYDISNATPTPVFLTGYTPPTDHTTGFPDSPGFTDQSWDNGNSVDDPGTAGSHPASVGGWIQFYVSVPGGKKRLVQAYYDGKWRHIGPEI